MRVAIIGSRTLTTENFGDYLPKNTTEIISGGAKGIDSAAKEYALLKGIKFREFLPDYRRFKKGAPLRRNIEIIEYSDFVLAFWDGRSAGTKFVIENCRSRGIPHKVIIGENSD